MKRKTLPSFILLTFLLTTCFWVKAQTIRYVKEGGTGNGSSWSNASGDLQAIINASASGDEVWVAKGTYKSTLDDINSPNPADPRKKCFQMKSGVGIYGGFAGVPAETQRSQRNWQTNRTILSADIGTPNDNRDNCYHVVQNYFNGLTATARLDGFTLTGGNANSATVVDSRGGGVINVESAPQFVNCIFTGNTSLSSGAGVTNQNASPTFINCVFFGNTSTDAPGGGMFNFNTAFPTLINCSFSGNRSKRGQSIAGEPSSSPTLINCILWGSNDELNDPATVSYSIVQGGYSGTGNLNQDALFVDAAAGNLRLQACSPAINAGSDAANTTDKDLDAAARKVGTIDMGAYEFQGTPRSVATFYKDNDGDGYGNAASSVVACDQPQGYVTNNFDFNNDDKNVYLPAFACPSDATVNNDKGKCGAVVNYSAPTAPEGNYIRAVNDTFFYSGSIVQWTVPQGVANLTITAKGAEGATSSSSSFPAGLGASIKGSFALAEGAVLKILVGGAPPNPDKLNASGGGGTFVTDAANAPLVVAGGGGGSGFYDTPSKQGQTAEAGGTGGDLFPGTGGTGGNGGGAAGAGAGGGLLTDGKSVGPYGGGKAFVHGGAAGTGDGYTAGFGGGGMGAEDYGGGGGGYSGGGSGGYHGVGGGGGSYNSGTNKENIGGVNSGNGLVVISYELPVTFKLVQTSGLSSGTEFPVGTTINRFALVQNDDDTLAVCSSTVTVKDNEAPTFTAPAGQNILLNKACSFTVPDLITGLIGTDNCGGIVNFSQSPLAGTLISSGDGQITTVSITATDARDNQRTVPVLLRAIDRTTPDITPPANISVSSKAGKCYATIANLGTPQVSENCTLKSVTNDAPATFPVGTTEVDWTATDAVGNSSITTQLVTVTDNEAPVITCPPAQMLSSTQSGTYTIPALVAGDNCGIQSTTYSITGATNRSGNGTNASGTFNPGISTITWSVKDVHGNLNTCSTIVTINNSTTPTITITLLPSFTIEGDKGKRPMLFVVALSKPASSTVSVKYNTTDGSAKAASDYEKTNGTISFSKGQWLKILCVQVYGDKKNEDNEQFFVQLSGPTNAKLNGTGKVVGIIVNDDGQHNRYQNKQGDKTVEEEDAGEIPPGKVYPNPTTGQFTLQLYAQKTETAQVTITDSKGSVIEQRKVSLVQGAQTISFNLSGKANGLYFVQVRSESGMQTYKLYLQH